MAAEPPREPGFRITTEQDPPEAVLAGFSAYGLAGLTAVDYLVDQLDLEEIGYVTTDALPPITPFEAGRPRHHTRLFSRPDLDVAILVNELFVPVWAATPFASTVLEWAAANGVSEIGVLAGVPVPHGPDEHRVFHVATEDFAAARLTETDIPGMRAGFLDGVNASLIGRGIGSPLRVGVFLTPVHAQVPDVEAAIRLVETVPTVYGIEVDSAPLKQFAAEVDQYYQELAGRLENVEPEHRPEDRMYM